MLHVLALLVASYSPLAPRPTAPVSPRLLGRPALLVDRRALVRLAADDDDDKGGELEISSGDMSFLRERIQKIQEQGGALATPAQKYFDMAMAKPPQQLMQDFFLKSSPTVTQAMSEAVTSLLGALPPFEFDAQMTTTGDKVRHARRSPIFRRRDRSTSFGSPSSALRGSLRL